VRYKFSSTVKEVSEQFSNKYVTGFGDNVVFQKASLGWYIHLEGSYEALYVGVERPVLQQGDRVSITIEKETK
jgi:hypothetical protein